MRCSELERRYLSVLSKLSILIQKEGILTTVQDLGRSGYARFGINENGAMDRAAARLLNILLGNSDNRAVLEFHFPAPRLKFETEAQIAIGGGDFAPILNEVRIPNWTIVNVQHGTELTFKEKRSGFRAYLAIGGGFDTEQLFGSRSTNLAAGFGGNDGRRLRVGDRVSFGGSKGKSSAASGRALSHAIIPIYSAFPTLRITAGPEFGSLSKLGQERLANETYKLTSESSRMGFRLGGSPIELTSHEELVTSAVAFGTIQIPPDGQPILLMADHQTTGGYPRIANVISHDLPLAAQLGPGDKVAFELVSVETAERLTLNFERELALLKVACRFNYGHS